MRKPAASPPGSGALSALLQVDGSSSDGAHPCGLQQPPAAVTTSVQRARQPAPVPHSAGLLHGQSAPQRRPSCIRSSRASHLWGGNADAVTSSEGDRLEHAPCLWPSTIR